MDNMGVQDPDEEFNRWLEERRRILEMNQEFKAASTRGGARERERLPRRWKFPNNNSQGVIYVRRRKERGNPGEPR
jgi:hypothetical protein